MARSEGQPRSISEISMDFHRLGYVLEKLGMQAKELVLEAVRHLPDLPRFKVSSYYDTGSESFVSEGEGIVLGEDPDTRQEVVVLMKDGIFRLPVSQSRGVVGLPDLRERKEVLLAGYIDYGEEAVRRIEEELRKASTLNLTI